MGNACALSGSPASESKHLKKMETVIVKRRIPSIVITFRMKERKDKEELEYLT
jgi:hypothetical protein